MPTLNISARSEDPRARALSNFAPYGFRLGDQWFASREGFIIGIMLEEGASERAQAFASTGFEAKKFAKLAKREFIWWEGKKFKYRGPEHIALLERGIMACFAQNSPLIKILLETEGLTLIHDLGRPEHPGTSLPAAEFCAILTSIREERLKELRS